MAGKAGKAEKVKEVGGKAGKAGKMGKPSNGVVPFTRQEAREWRQIEVDEESVQDVVRQYQARRSAFWERWRRRTGYPVSRIKEVAPKKVILFAPNEVPPLRAQAQQQMAQRMAQMPQD